MLKNCKNFLLSLWKEETVRTLLFPWAVIFIIFNLANTQDGGPNAVSRFLTMRAMSEEASFRIDQRIGASADWAHTPDGHYFANKAPGPMLLGFPAFLALDQIPRLWEKGYRDEHGQRHTPGYFQKTWTCILNQILPFLILMAVLLVWMQRRGIARSTQLYFILATFFGSTVSLYYNNYSGHGFEAILQLALVFFLIEGNYFGVGFTAGSCLLSDYSFGMQLPAFLLALMYAVGKKRDWKKAFLQVAAGGIFPGILWVWYHVSCFQSPFATAKSYENPIFLDVVNEAHNVLGIFRLPSPTVLWELLFGPSRGLLVTQPWILFLVPVATLFYFLPKKGIAADLKFERTLLGIFCTASLAALLFMNMSYGGWQGGGCAGPRYLSGPFLCFAFWATLEMKRFPKWLQYAFWGLLGVSLVFRGLVYGSTILGPGLPLWQWYMEEFTHKSKTPILRAAIYVLLLVIGFVWQKKLWKTKRA